MINNYNEILDRGYYYLDEITEDFNVESVPLRKITAIKLRGNEEKLALPEILKKMDFIKEVDFSGSAFTNEDLDKLPPHLKKLHLNNCTRLTKFSKAFKDSQPLKVLNICGTHVTSLKNLPSCLRELDASKSYIRQVILSPYSDLEKLNLSKTPIESINLSGKIKHLNLSKCRHLNKVNLQDETLLKYLDLSNSGTDYTFTFNRSGNLKLPHSIEHLNLSYSTYDLDPSEIPYCEELYLDGLPVLMHLDEIIKCTHLKMLSLKNCKYLSNKVLKKMILPSTTYMMDKGSIFEPPQNLSLPKKIVKKILLSQKKHQVRQDRLETLNLEGTPIDKQTIKKIKSVYKNLTILK